MTIVHMIFGPCTSYQNYTISDVYTKSPAINNIKINKLIKKTYYKIKIKKDCSNLMLVANTVLADHKKRKQIGPRYFIWAVWVVSV
jgi:ribosomal protein S27AE